MQHAWSQNETKMKPVWVTMTGSKLYRHFRIHGDIFHTRVKTSALTYVENSIKWNRCENIPKHQGRSWDRDEYSRLLWLCNCSENDRLPMTRRTWPGENCQEWCSKRTWSDRIIFTSKQAIPNVVLENGIWVFNALTVHKTARLCWRKCQSQNDYLWVHAAMTGASAWTLLQHESNNMS